MIVLFVQKCLEKIKILENSQMNSMNNGGKMKVFLAMPYSQLCDEHYEVKSEYKKFFTKLTEELKKINFEPNSISSIEKELKKLREEKNAKTMFHLAYLLQKGKAL